MCNISLSNLTIMLSPFSGGCRRDGLAGQKNLTEKPPLVASDNFAGAGDLVAEETPGHIVKQSYLLAQLL